MPKNERYYSAQYSVVDEPSASNLELNQYADPNQHLDAGSRTVTPAPNTAYTAYNPDAHNPAYGYEDDHNSLKAGPKPGWSWKRKIIVFGGIAAFLVIAIAVGVGVGVALGTKSTYDYAPSTAQVTNETAFGEGATKQSSSNVTDGIGAGKDEYTYYSGTASNFPNVSSWISFEDMWAGNLYKLQNSCKTNGVGKNNS
jgi:hypothetical protein